MSNNESAPFSLNTMTAEFDQDPNYNITSGTMEPNSAENSLVPDAGVKMLDSQNLVQPRNRNPDSNAPGSNAEIAPEMSFKRKKYILKQANSSDE